MYLIGIRILLFFSDQYASVLCVCKREIDKISADESDFLQGQELKLCTLNS